ncbi:hypothetical protein L5515_006642 [Caenorhabditis briggsae]|uniref:Lipase n=1 Tax=Caenorhabditis briggsae TaxID=6238 RepID=A0AAE9F326_CAEBR|nr:hypothetical protein L5515_006642 [Caenorhabditis briggsae]
MWRLAVFLSLAAFFVHDVLGKGDPELKMTTPQIIERWGYPAMIYSVTTDDGYILEMHRIPFGKTNVTWPNGKRPVIFLQHGLLCASSDWVLNLPDQSAGFIFADAGFDVWMAFWDWSWDEMATYDLNAMINHVLEVTGQESVYYMGHSQGTLTMFSHLSKDDGSFAKKIKKFFALAPIGSVKHIKGFLAFFANYFSLEFDGWFDIFGAGEFLPNNWAMKLAAKDICGGLQIESDLCDNVLFLIAGPESDQWNQTRVPVYATHDPAGTSTQNIVHWMQMVHHGGVPAYDWGTKENKKKYGQANPPEYDFTAIKGTQIYLYWSDADWLGDKVDITDYLLTHLDPAVIAQNNHLPDYNHLDFTWGLRAPQDIYHPAVELCTNDYLGK